MISLPMPESRLFCKNLDNFSKPPRNDLLPLLIQYSQLIFLGSVVLTPQ